MPVSLFFFEKPTWNQHFLTKIGKCQWKTPTKRVTNTTQSMSICTSFRCIATVSPAKWAILCLDARERKTNMTTDDTRFLASEVSGKVTTKLLANTHSCTAPFVLRINFAMCHLRPVAIIPHSSVCINTGDIYVGLCHGTGDMLAVKCMLAQCYSVTFCCRKDTFTYVAFAFCLSICPHSTTHHQ